MPVSPVPIKAMILFGITSRVSLLPFCLGFFLFGPGYVIGFIAFQVW